MTAPTANPRIAGALIATDLDRTMIYSRSAITGPPAAHLCVEYYDGAPLSYMSHGAVAALRELSSRTIVVPVTTRTLAQFDRIELPGAPFGYAVVSNGGRIVRGGHDDAVWRTHLDRRVGEQSVPLVELHAELLRRIDESWVRSVRIADDLFAYLVVDVDHQPADFAAEFGQWCQPRGWTISQQGRKIYAMPVGVTKSAAIAEVRRQLLDAGTLAPDAPLLAAGDGRLDADLLTAADRAIRPRHGELHERGWTIPGLAVTTASGIDAGSEILRWFAAHNPQSDHPPTNPALAENSRH